VQRDRVLDQRPRGTRSGANRAVADDGIAYSRRRQLTSIPRSGATRSRSCIDPRGRREKNSGNTRGNANRQRVDSSRSEIKRQSPASPAPSRAALIVLGLDEHVLLPARPPMKASKDSATRSAPMRAGGTRSSTSESFNRSRAATYVTPHERDAHQRSHAIWSSGPLAFEQRRFRGTATLGGEAAAVAEGARIPISPPTAAFAYASAPTAAALSKARPPASAIWQALECSESSTAIVHACDLREPPCKAITAPDGASRCRPVPSLDPTRSRPGGESALSAR